MDKYVVIVAGGLGSRMQSEIPKQFLLLNSTPILAHTLQQFYNFDKTIEIILVLPKNQITYWKLLCKEHQIGIPHHIVLGGKTRFHSVLNGLNSVISKKGIVGIHDGVRPFVSLQTLKNCFNGAIANGNAVPAINIYDSMRKVKGEENNSVDRADYKIVQTPQCFNLEQLKEAYQTTYSSKFTDDASVLEASGATINLVEGNRENIKITIPEDLKYTQTD